MFPKPLAQAVASDGPLYTAEVSERLFAESGSLEVTTLKGNPGDTSAYSGKGEG